MSRSKSHRGAIAAIALAAALGLAPAAMAVPPGGGGDDDAPLHCPAGYKLVDDVCVKIPPPAPVNNPVVSLDLARQTTDRTGIRIVGKATDADQPQTTLTVKIRVDGVQVKTLTANLPDPPVATTGFAAGTVPAGHGFDAVVPAAATAQTVCLTAVNVGSGSDSTVCKTADAVVEFAGNRISYDLDHLKITASSLEELDRVTNVNSTTVQQSTTISGKKTVTDKHGWEHTQGVKVTVEGKIGIPVIDDFKIAIEGSLEFKQNGEVETAREFSWEQPVIVPAKSTVVATVAVTDTTLVVPYTVFGDYVYASGTRVAGGVGGTYTGDNNHDLEVTLKQFNLDGTPAALPVQQPKATLLKVS